MKTIKLIILAAIGTFVTSCDSNTYSEISGFTATPTYEANIKPIMVAQCTSCHSANGTEPGSPLENYQEVVDYAESISCRIDGQDCDLMPSSGRIPQVQIDMFNLWVAQGFLQQ